MTRQLEIDRSSMRILSHSLRSVFQRHLAKLPVNRRLTGHKRHSFCTASKLRLRVRQLLGHLGDLQKTEIDRWLRSVDQRIETKFRSSAERMTLVSRQSAIDG